MQSPDPKTLKKLAAACRAAGIKHYKCADFEFTLADEVPMSPYKKAKYKESEKTDTSPYDIATDALSEEQLLFWSSDPLAQNYLKDE